MREHELRKRFGYDELVEISRPLLDEDYVFDVEKHPSLKEFKVVHQEVSMIETPLVLVRRVYLGHVGEKQSTLKLGMTLCWNGFRDALDALFGFAESFERPIPVEAVLNTTEVYQIGGFGLSWSWLGEGEPDILCFIKNNVLVTLQGRNLVTVAKEIDGELKGLKTTRKYAEEEDAIFSEVKKKEGEVPKVKAGGHLTLPAIPNKEQSFFFFTTSGSVNRDVDRPRFWYYRAGMEKGKQEVILFRVKSGILPKKERLILEVT
jgi:hypothetical protein